MKLQGVYGNCESVRAADLKVGMLTFWNYGACSIVKAIEPTKSGKSVKVIFECEDGKEYPRTMRSDRQVAVIC